MNKTLISRLVIGALATLAAGGAFAGQIGAASAPMAREVITSNTVVVSAPTTSYHFAGDINATTADQVFQVQLTLNTKGVPSADTAASLAIWDTSVLPSTDAFQFGDTTGAPIAAAVVTARGFSDDKKTLWVTFTVPVAAGYVTTPTVTFNPVGSTTPALVKNLKDVVGDLYTDFTTSQKCSDNKSMPVGILHFKGLTDPMTIATGSVATGGNGNGSADEHTRTNATNEGVAIVFPTDLLVKMTKPTTNNATLATGGNLLFANTGAIPQSATTAYQDTNNVLLGNIALTQLGQGYDQDFGIPALSSKYVLSSTAVVPVALGVVTSTLSDPLPAGAKIDGTVEVAGVYIDVTASSGFLPGAVLYAVAPAALCNATVAAGVITPPGAALGSYKVLSTDGNTVRLSLDGGTAGLAAALNAGTKIGVCYAVPGTGTVPSSSFTAVGTVVKNIGVKGEQNNQCAGPFTSFGGGIKIDVRNYASSKETSGYSSVIRLINNSDARKADVWAQIIHQDGTLGNWGKIADLEYRGIVNMTAAQIEAKLTNAPTAAIGVAAPISSALGAPRLRITSTTGTSLRVQNYLFNAATGQILEASGSQAVDYEGNNIQRAPVTDGQYISQDANSGLNLQ